jgi:hypothetical protein
VDHNFSAIAYLNIHPIDAPVFCLIIMGAEGSAHNDRASRVKFYFVIINLNYIINILSLFSSLLNILSRPTGLIFWCSRFVARYGAKVTHHISQWRLFEPQVCLNL